MSSAKPLRGKETNTENENKIFASNIGIILEPYATSQIQNFVNGLNLKNTNGSTNISHYSAFSV